MKHAVRVVAVLLCIVLAMLANGCARPYPTPQQTEISPSQTAYLIPLDGKTGDQVQFTSTSFLEKAKVATKRVEIPMRWFKTGKLHNSGKWVPTLRLIVVERKPITREWTDDSQTGTSSANQAIPSESKESIGFYARMNCSAQIDESDASLYLYRFNDKPLEEVMDSLIRPAIATAFVEECGRRTMQDIIVNKQSIMDSVRAKIIPAYKQMGVNITVLGLQGELSYMDPNIQKAINLNFTSAKERDAQAAINEKVVSKAAADAKAVQIMRSSGADQYQLKLKALDNQAAAIDAWAKGAAMPSTIAGGGGLLFNIPTK